MTYLVLSLPSEAYAEGFSEALYALSSPATSVTKYAVPWVIHPATGDVALRLGDKGSYLQPYADIAAFISQLPITETEASDLTATMDTARGTHLRYVDMLPPSLQDALRTDDEMAADEWFSEFEI